GCSRPAAHLHHIEYRAHGGSNDESNLLCLCAAHHLFGIHDERMRVTGKAPDELVWEFGLRRGWTQTAVPCARSGASSLQRAPERVLHRVHADTGRCATSATPGSTLPRLSPSGRFRLAAQRAATIPREVPLLPALDFGEAEVVPGVVLEHRGEAVRHLLGPAGQL